MSKKQFFKVGDLTRTQVTLLAPHPQVPAQYPSEYFVNNKNKPKVVLSVKGLNVENIRAVINSGLSNNNLRLAPSLYFIYLYFLNVKTVLTKKWESFGIKFGDPNEEVTPWSLIDVQLDSDSGVDHPSLEGIAKSDDNWIICLLLSMHRLKSGMLDSYREIIQKRIYDQMHQYGYKKGGYPSSFTSEDWAGSLDFTRMVAAIDMFLSKFPTLVQSQLRICTLTSRFKDCTALMSLGFIKEVLCLPDESEFLDWIFTAPIAAEAEAMARHGQETLEPDSYFPYQSDLRLVNRTHYSASANENIFFLIHAIGSLLHVQRSMNAKKTTDKNIINNSCNAKIIAYVFSNTFKMAKQYQAIGGPAVQKRNLNINKPEDLEPKTQNAALWYAYMQSYDFKLTPNMRAFVERSKAEMGETREGTIGHYVQHHF
ncbi:nucleocapsid [Wuhan Insect virus 7]|uniref:nucleocapsid n=1 Tax=Wuhan Insect virus 7 TaxID=1608112 RepID=UPI0005AD655C|nr:nucleocapsid [Wuhan Insect virus 7]AJG39192.1 nucleocapsid [Wuhan Insect virus 7]